MQHLVEALGHLRTQGARIHTADSARFEHWFDGLAALIAELPSEDMRIAWVAMIADDLSRRMPGLPMAMAAVPLWRRVENERERYHAAHREGSRPQRHGHRH